MHLTVMHRMALEFSRRDEVDLLSTDDRKRKDLAVLVTEHHAGLLRVAYVILGDAALAEDAAQGAWLQAWRRIDQLRDPDKVRSWLLSVAANEARQIARKRRTVAPVLTIEPQTREADPRLTDLTASLARLDPSDRQLLALKYVAGFTSEQIGKAMGTSAGAVRHRSMRLLARLRRELES